MIDSSTPLSKYIHPDRKEIINSYGLSIKFKSGISEVNWPTNDWPLFIFNWLIGLVRQALWYINLNFPSPFVFVSPQLKSSLYIQKKYSPPRLNVINGHRVFGLSFLARYVRINKTHHFWLNRTFEHEMSPLGVHTTYGLYLFSLVLYNSSMCFANP